MTGFVLKHKSDNAYVLMRDGMQQQEESRIIAALQLLTDSQRDFALDFIFGCAKKNQPKQPKLVLVSSVSGASSSFDSGSLSRKLS
jgi:hypothetical protein